MMRMGKDLRLPAFVLLAVLASGSTVASSQIAQSGSGLVQPVAASDAQIRAAIDTWRRITRSDTLGFATYADFLLANPGWPEEARLRGVAERSINPDVDDPSRILAFFDRFPAQSAQARAVHALTLARLARLDQAREMARLAWVAGPMDQPVEDRLRAQFGSSFTPDDNLRRADAALWKKRPDVAERVLAFVPVTRQAVIAARIAFQRKAPDAAQKMAAADPIGMMDAGYLADKARWLVDTGNSMAARQLLAGRGPLAMMPSDPESWYEVLLAQARAAANDTQWSLAYAIASKVDDAFAPGTDISLQTLGVRDDYTSLVWLAGTAALNHLRRPADAETMFERYGNAARSPQTISKGYYWAGRAALAAGRSDAASNYFARASAFGDQYYGQLSLERLGRPIPRPAAAHAVRIDPAERTAFNNRSVVRAARQLGADGQYLEQSKMLYAIARTALTDHDQALVSELSRSLGRPDLRVNARRAGMSSGLAETASDYYPSLDVPDDLSANWTMIHAISRQESQFYPRAISPVGARGLMQLMPATARETAGKLGVGYDESQLWNPGYNMRLGSSYFQRMLNYYGGSYVLAVAAYNAGPGNVNRWLSANGDPRLAGTDVVEWVEDIPIFETRNYVQRVLENAVIYDMLNPRQQLSAVNAPLSRYLGKSRPG